MKHNRPRVVRTLDDLLRYGYVSSNSNGCWIWNRLRWENGYGRVGDERAHRVSYEFAFGDPEDALVCHGCDVVYCVNPNHLWLGTQYDNMHDMINKGRKIVVRGDDHMSYRPEHRARMTTDNPMQNPEVRAKVTGSAHWSKRYPERWAQHTKKLAAARAARKAEA